MEIFCESVPSAILQTYVVITQGYDTLSVISIAISTFNFGRGMITQANIKTQNICEEILYSLFFSCDFFIRILGITFLLAIDTWKPYAAIIIATFIFSIELYFTHTNDRKAHDGTKVKIFKYFVRPIQGVG